MKINQKSINTLRVLSAEMISNSQIGDTRVCYNLAPVVFTLFKEQYNFFGGKDNINRDRLVIADTNATALVYAALHQFGLGLTVSDLKNFGAVSPQVAAQMAEGVRALAGADMGISTTGIAGPTGGSVEKPVGTVFIGISTGDKTRVVKGDFSAKFNNRDKNRQLSSCLAIYCGFSSI